jgi:hypothetical protein
MSDDLYCKVYVMGTAGTAGVLSAAVVQAAVSAATGQPFQRRSTQAHGLAIDVFEADARATASAADRGDFLRWPVYLEIEPAHGTLGLPAFIEALARLLNALNARGLRTVASCDFEDALAAAQRALTEGPAPAA